MRGNTIMACVLSAAVLGPTAGQAQQPAAKAPATNDVEVTVAYTGKAKVDDTHEIWVFLFDNADLARAGRPRAVQAVKKSGGMATFKGVTTDPVYVAVAFDEKGDYDGNAAPPPAGTPIGMYTTDGKLMAAVKPGPKGKVKVSFNETRRMQ